MVVTVIKAITALQVGSGSGTGGQTPWTSDIDGAQHNLFDVNNIAADSYNFYYPSHYQAAVFNGSNSQVGGLTNNLPSGDNPSSVFAWVKSNTSSGGQIIHAYGTNSTKQQRLFYLANNGFNLNVGTNLAQTTSGGINDGNWHLVGYVYSGGGVCKFYKDNVLLTNSTNIGSAINTVIAGLQYIGQTPSLPGNVLNASVQFDWVFNIALSTTQINDLWNSGAGVASLPASISSANLITRYDFNGNANETSGSGNTDFASNITFTVGHVATGSYVSKNLFQYDQANNLLDILLSTSVAGSLSAVTGSTSATLANGTYAISASGDINLTNGIFKTQTAVAEDGNGSYFLASTGYGFNIGGSTFGSTNIPFMQATHYQVTNNVFMQIQPYAGRLGIGAAIDNGITLLQVQGEELLTFSDNSTLNLGLLNGTNPGLMISDASSGDYAKFDIIPGTNGITELISGGEQLLMGTFGGNNLAISSSGNINMSGQVTDNSNGIGTDGQLSADFNTRGLYPSNTTFTPSLDWSGGTYAITINGNTNLNGTTGPGSTLQGISGDGNYFFKAGNYFNSALYTDNSGGAGTGNVVTLSDGTNAVTATGNIAATSYSIGATAGASGTDGAGTVFNNGIVTTVGASAGVVPKIIGNARALGKTAAFALATYTVGASDTTFQVSANVLITASTAFSFSVTCTYTDEGNTSRTLTLNFSQISGTLIQTLTNVLGAGAYEGVPLQIRAKAGTTIVIQSTGTFTTVTYNLEERIIQL